MERFSDIRARVEQLAQLVACDRGSVLQARLAQPAAQGAGQLTMCRIAADGMAPDGRGDLVYHAHIRAALEPPRRQATRFSALRGYETCQARPAPDAEGLRTEAPGDHHPAGRSRRAAERAHEWVVLSPGGPRCQAILVFCPLPPAASPAGRTFPLS